MRKLQMVLGLVALLIHLISRGGMAVILLGIIIGALLVPTLTA
jgi:hypothetical protein